MKDVDVERCVEQALNRAVEQRPKLLSDNGPCYKSNELKDFLNHNGIQHINGSPNHPQTQGKIERYHRSMKDIIKLDNYYMPQELERRLKEFVDYYNNHRYHESLKNLKPVDVYLGRDQKILQENQNIKRKTMQSRRMYYLKELNYNQQAVS
jgi:putative transposase